jgi:hypothetical protein
MQHSYYIFFIPFSFPYTLVNWSKLVVFLDGKYLVSFYSTLAESLELFDLEYFSISFTFAFAESLDFFTN